MNISQITKVIDSAMATARKGFTLLPSLILFCSSIKKPGISTILTTAKIISELGKNGFPTGPNEDGSTNMFNQYTKIMVDNIFTELKDNMQVQVSLPYGAVPIIGFGANGGGAVTVHGFNNVAITAAGSAN